MRYLRHGWVGLLLLGTGVGLALAQQPDQPQAAAEEGKPDSGAGESASDSPFGWGVFAGQLFGDTISELTFQGGFTPELDDSVLLGGYLTLDIGEQARLELRLAASSTTVLNTPNGDIDGTLYELDIAWIPRFGRGRVRWGMPVGAGWATFDEDADFSNPAQIPLRDPNLIASGGSGVVYFLGLQAEFPLRGRTSFVIDGRFKRYHRLQNVMERTAKTAEVTVGLRWDR